MSLPTETISKLSKLFPRLASNHDGEVVATARAIMRTLNSAGRSLHDLGEELEPKVVQQIVYREKVVYRDRPAENPADVQMDKPEWVMIEDKQRIVRLADILLNGCDLSASEEQFVRHMRHDASRRPKMRMSVKQQSWWDSLLTDHDVEAGVSM